MLRPERRCAINVLEPYSGPILAHRFWGWVFLRCGARFWAPITRGKCHFRTSSSGPKSAPLTFLGRSPCGPAWVGAEKNALPAVSRIFLGNGRDASQNSTSSGKNPMETAERSVFGLIDRNNTEDDQVRDIKRAQKNCVLAAVSCVEGQIRSFALRFGEVALFSPLLRDLLEFGAGLCECLGFNMVPFGSFFLCCCFVLWRLSHTPHLTMAGQIQPSTVPTGPATVLWRKCVWDCPFCSDTPLSQNSAHKTNRNKNRTKGMRPFSWKKCAVGFVVAWIIRGTVATNGPAEWENGFNPPFFIQNTILQMHMHTISWTTIFHRLVGVPKAGGSFNLSMGSPQFFQLHLSPDWDPLTKVP